jgi:hypothetical protein
MIVVIPAECGVTLYGGERFRFRAADAPRKEMAAHG